MPVYPRIGALDVAEAISQLIGSYVDMNFMQFVDVEGDAIHCWYKNSGGQGPSVEITIERAKGGWAMRLTEHPPGTQQTREIP